MSRFDVLRSFVRAAGDRLDVRALRARLARALTETTLARLDLGDAALTAAVARGRGISSATVASDGEAVRVDVSVRDGAALAFALVPSGVQFAPGGAKELAFRIEPADAPDGEASREAFSAIAGVIAETLWRPALAGSGGGGGASAFVARQGGELVLDLRTVPSIRAASRNRVGLAILETLVLKSVEVRPGGLRLAIGVRGMA